MSARKSPQGGGAWLRSLRWVRWVLAATGSLGTLAACPPGDDELPDDDDPLINDDDDSSSDDDDDGDGDDDDDSSPALPALRVNELQSDNVGLVADEQGRASDWIELFNPTSDPVALDGWHLSDDWTQPTLHPLPSGLSVPAGGFLLLWADGTPDVGALHLPFRLAAVGEAVGLFAPDGAAIDWVEFPPMSPGQAYARLPDGGSAFSIVARGTPGAPNEDLIEQTTPLVVAGAVWSYDDGDGAALPADWQDSGFDDAAWPSGDAPLGYGDPVATTIGFGPDPNDKFVTARFRLRFVVDPSVAADSTSLALSLRADDGAILWLNGQELARVNLPSGPIAVTTPASTTVSGADETALRPQPAAALPLLPGENLLSAQVHQADPQSSDLGFDVELHAIGWTPR